ncbi:MAG TPA: ferrous iron transport protein A [Pyrinomonadaceae bacterium]|nr:ferrous iron transport protein A [Pyrinomonadaceae bacterium]
MSALINVLPADLNLDFVEPTSLQKNAVSLDSMPRGKSARVVSVAGSGAIARRLMEMGVLPGAPVRVVRTAPLGDPIQICIRNYHLALRRVEAQTITVVASEG